MSFRMLCMQCLHMDEPDTVLDGSDRIEFIAWCCFLVPGFLYGAWRHLSRAKACPACGSHVLMRESRAATARRPFWADPSRPPRVLSDGGFDWPTPFASVRRRLRVGGLGALLVAIAGMTGLVAVFDATPGAHSLETATLAWLVVTTWLVRQFLRLVRSRHGSSGCEAWDEGGRSLHIERV